MMRRLSWLAIVGLAGCHNTPAPTLSAYDIVASQIDAQGAVTVGTARQAFGIFFGALPGEADPPGEPSTVMDANIGLELMEQHAAELTPAQAQVLSTVDKKLDSNPMADAATQARFQQLTMDASKTVGSELGIGPLPIMTIVYANSPTVMTKQGPTTFYGLTRSYDAAGMRVGPWASCTIRYSHLAVVASDQILAEIIPHEVFHCYQGYMAPDIKAARSAPQWIAEGSATWVQGAVSGHITAPALKDGTPSGAWIKCLGAPQTSLYTLTYDALCFFAEMDYRNRSPWLYYSDVATGFYTGNNRGAMAGGMDTGVMVDWATSYFRTPMLGKEWDITGPSITATAATPVAYEIANGTNTSGDLSAASNKIYALSLTAEVARWTLPPTARLRSSDGSFDSVTASGDWCTQSGGCDCPMGTKRAGMHLSAMPPGNYNFAIAAGPTDASWTAIGMTLDDYCESDLVDPCLQGTWMAQTVSGDGDIDNGDCTYNKPLGVLDTFNKDGSAVEDYSQTSAVTCTTAGIVAVASYSGRVTATVRASNGNIQFSNVDNSGAMFNVTVNGMPFPGLAPTFGLASSSGSLSYTCSGNSLQLQASGSGYDVGWVYQKQ